MELYRGKTPKRTTIITLCLITFLAGLALARTRIFFSPVFIWLSPPFLFITAKRSRLALTINLVLLGLFLGWWRGANYLQHVNKYQLFYKQKVTIVGIADTEGIYDKLQLTFDLINPKVTKPIPQKLVGKISVRGYGANAVFRGDKIEVSGKLYHTRGSKQGGISFAKISVLERSTSTTENIRRKFVAGMYNALPEPLGSFALGLLVGQRNTLPEDLNDQLSAVGLTHIVAVSGYNLTIIMLAVGYVLKNRSKYQATLISVLLIGIFLLFTGFSASIVRAAIISALALMAGYFGRKFKPLVLILLTAVLTAGWYPIYIWSDIGWYLSFLAFFGVLIIGPLVTKRFYKRQPKLLGQIITESLSAQIMALPLIMYIFGEISLVSLPANVLIVPLVPLAMLLSFIAGLAGMLIPALAGWLAWPAKILLTYVLDLVGLMAKIPNALAMQSLSLAKLMMVYALIVFLVFVLWSKISNKNDTITDMTNEEM